MKCLMLNVSRHSIAPNVLQISEGKDLETKILTQKQNVI